MSDLPAKASFRVFLNYPFDDEFSSFSTAMHFAVTAANLIPICAKDVGTPDRLRLQLLADLVTNCDFSAHDLSRYKPDGQNGFARMNMPFETGMALYRSMSTNFQAHRCALLVTDAHAYKAFVSDLAGLDAMHYEDDISLVRVMYDWLASVGPQAIASTASSSYVEELYLQFRRALGRIRGSGPGGALNHAEMQELTRRVCGVGKLWTWRNGPLADEFPYRPLLFERASRYQRKGDHEPRAGRRRGRA